MALKASDYKAIKMLTYYQGVLKGAVRTHTTHIHELQNVTMFLPDVVTI